MSRNITLCTIGSRGDCQPYVALGLSLKARGHTVTVATEQRNFNLISEFGLNFKCVSGDSCGMLYESKYQSTLKSGSFIGLINMTNDWNSKFDKKEILQSYVSALSGADIIISGALTLTQTFCVAEANKAVWIPMILGPTLTTSEFPLWALQAITCGCSCLNKWTYNLAFKALWDQEKIMINQWREETLALKPITLRKGISDILDTMQPPILIACSKLLCGIRREIPEDYPSNAHLEGFAFVPSSSWSSLSADDNPSHSQLSDFIISSSSESSEVKFRLIYFGFGSMPAPEPILLIRLAIDVCKKLPNTRGVVVAGWSELETPECLELLSLNKDRIHVIKSAPHEWLFPKMDCIVHHCGVGTMAAAMRAGKPQIPCPFMLDQPHNSKIIIGLLCAPCALPYASLNCDNLYNAIHKVLHEKDGEIYRRHASELGQRIRAESECSLDKYCDLVEGALPNWKKLEGNL